VKAKVAQIDLVPENLGRRTAIDIGLIGDVGATLRALLPRLTGESDGAFLQSARAKYAEARKGLDELADGTPGSGVIHPQHVARIVSALADDDAVFACDVGTPTIWAARYLAMNGRRRLIGSFNHGSMANALPQAIGVQSAFPKRQIVTLSGDGGLAMLMGELLTVRQLGLPVKIVVALGRTPQLRTFRLIVVLLGTRRSFSLLFRAPMPGVAGTAAGVWIGSTERPIADTRRSVEARGIERWFRPADRITSRASST
jgi:glyoxylate carboligase